MAELSSRVNQNALGMRGKRWQRHTWPLGTSPLRAVLSSSTPTTRLPAAAHMRDLIRACCGRPRAATRTHSPPRATRRARCGTPGMQRAHACSDRSRSCQSCREAAPQRRAYQTVAKQIELITFDQGSTACPRTRQHAGRVSTVMACRAAGVLPRVCKAAVSVLKLASPHGHARAHMGKHGRAGGDSTGGTIVSAHLHQKARS